MCNLLHLAGHVSILEDTVSSSSRTLQHSSNTFERILVSQTLKIVEIFVAEAHAWLLEI